MRWTINLIVLGLAFGVLNVYLFVQETLVMETIGILFTIGPLGITRTVLTTALLVLTLVVCSWLATRRLSVDRPGLLQTALERGTGRRVGDRRGVARAFGAAALRRNTLAVCRRGESGRTDSGSARADRRTPGDDRGDGHRRLLFGALVRDTQRRLAQLPAPHAAPNPILLPFHLLGELSRTLALAVRLFGNIMSLEMAALLILLVAGLLVPVPVLMLHLVEALVQAYIFGMLALIYIAGGMRSWAARASQHSSPHFSRLQRERKLDMSDMHWFVLISTVVAALAIAVGIIFPALAMGKAIVQSLESLARQPEAGRPSPVRCSSAWR